MKKLLSLVLVATLLLGAALSLTSCSTLEFGTSGMSMTVYGVKNPNVKKLVIPEKGKGVKITLLLGECLTECKKLESITIPSTVTEIDGAVFYGCESLVSITVDENNPVYHSEGNCIIETETNILVAGCKGSVIPDYVTEIGYYAFAGTGIESIEIPENVVSIDWGAFKDCKSLKSIWIHKNVTYLGDYILNGCSALESIVVEDGNEMYFTIDNCLMQNGLLLAGCKTSIIPKVAVKIGDRAFSGCSEMESITLPNNIRAIGDRVFEGCAALKTINYNDDMSMWNALDKDEGWDYKMPPCTLNATDGSIDLMPEIPYTN